MSESLERFREREQQLLCRTYSRYPIAVERGRGARLWDFDGKEYVDLLAGIAVVLGHMYPVFYKFKGGKGVATSLGTSLVLNPLLGLILLAVSAVGIAITHVVSIFSIVSLVAFGLINPFLCKGDVAEIVYSIVLALLVVWAHRTNIKRLLSGTENKLDFSRKTTKRNLK